MKYYYIKSLEKILEHAENRKIVLYGTERLSQVIYQHFVHMNREVLYFVDENYHEGSLFGKEVRDPLDLIYENKDEIYVLCFMMKDHGAVYSKLTGYGLLFEKEFGIYGIGGYIQKFDAVDSMLGFTRLYDGLTGFKVYGDSKKKNTVKIMTLGGSTSDPSMGNYMTWPEYLYHELKEKYDVIVYSGGMGGYCVHQELLKFLRDGLALHPDILITFDGYNDVGYQVSVKEHPYMHRYQKKFYDFVENHNPMAPDTLDMRGVRKIEHGVGYLETEDSWNWYQGIRTIHAVAKEHGIQYFAFLQPMQDTGRAVIDESITELKELYLCEDMRVRDILKGAAEFADGCRKYIKNDGYITDLTDIFDGEADVYYDICHSTDKGHRMIMKHILKKIKPVMEEYRKC